MSRANRERLKGHGIEHTGRPLGRKPKESLSRYKKQKLKKDRAERNQIEGKHAYNLNKIMAKIPETQQRWIAAIIFMMNILKLSRDFFCVLLKKLQNSILLAFNTTLKQLWDAQKAMVLSPAN